MKLAMIICMLALPGCFRAAVPDLPDVPAPGPEVPDEIGFLISIGYWGTGLGAVALFAAIIIGLWLKRPKLALSVGVSGCASIGVGLGLIWVGPWLAWIVGGISLLAAVVVGFLAWRNRERIVDRIEDATGLDVDGDGQA